MGKIVSSNFQAELDLSCKRLRNKSYFRRLLNHNHTLWIRFIIFMHFILYFVQPFKSCTYLNKWNILDIIICWIWSGNINFQSLSIRTISFHLHMYTYAYNFTKFIDSTHRGVAQCVVRLSQQVKLYPVKN